MTEFGDGPDQIPRNHKLGKIGKYQTRVYPDFIEIEVPSSKADTEPWSVIVGPDDHGKDTVECNCPSYYFRQSCRHVQLVRKLISS